MLRVHVAHSEDPETAGAVTEILETLSRDAGPIGAGAALLVFAAIDADHQVLLDRLADASPGALVVGCTTDGEASIPLGFQEDSVVVVALVGEGVELTAGVGRQVSADPVAAAAAAVAQARAGATLEPALALTFPDSLTTSGVAVVEALQAALGRTFPLLGGTAGDQLRFRRTHQFFGREVLTDTVPVLLVSGPVRFGHGVASGWHPVGRQVPVTQAVANRVVSIGSQSALDFYRSYLGPTKAPLGEYALAVFEPEGDRFYLRAPFAVDEADGSITFAGDVPIGALVQLTDVDRGCILEAARESIQHALDDYGAGTPDAALFFSCAGRKTTLGSAAEQEVQQLRGMLPVGLPVAGFYAYGEIGPLDRGAEPRFHNQTFITLLIGS